MGVTILGGNMVVAKAVRCLGRSGVVVVSGLLTALQVFAVNPRFVPSVTGEEVVDNKTGLIWRRCSEGQKWVDGACVGVVSRYDWGDALVHAENEAVSAGVRWRVPNVKELESLVDRSMTMPAIDGVFFPDTPFDNPVYPGYGESSWTSTLDESNQFGVWCVDFKMGYTGLAARSSSQPVRLVRSVR